MLKKKPRLNLLILMKISILFIGLFSFKNLSAQCGNIIPVDLSGNPSGSFRSIDITRNEKCCSSSSTDCIQFSVTLNANAIGLIFNIVEGALPSGALFYSINCGPEIPINNVICLSGGQTYQVTFCKPGNNNNIYEIVSIPGLEIPDLSVKQGCSQTFDTKLPTSNGSITWTSSTPGALSYLSCTNCPTPAFTPTSSTPATLSYTATWSSSIVTCGTTLTSSREVFVTTLPKPTINVTPLNKVFCQNSTNAEKTLTVNITGPGSGYNIAWYNSNNPSFVLGTSSTFVPPANGQTTNYTVKVTDQNDPCSFQTFEFPVTHQPVPTFSIDDKEGCKNDSLTFSLSTNFTYTFSPTTGITSLGGGNYKLINSGNQTYTVTATNGFGCKFIDTFRLTVKECTICPPNVIKCSSALYPPFSTITAFIAGGGAINFPCPYLNTNITLLSETQTGTDCNGLLERNYEIFDDCGNSAICKQLITLKDTTAPQFLIFPGNYTAQCPTIPAPITPTFNDNCDANPVLTFLSEIVNGTCANQKTVRYTWTLKDKCGNTNERTQTIQIVDTQVPVITNTPPNVTVSCGNIPLKQDPTFTDNCSASNNLNITFLEETIPGNCANNKTIKRTWTARDECDNQSTYVQTITVKDLTAPTFSSLPADINVSCTNIPANAILTVSDSCDMNPSLTFTSVQLPGSCPNEYTIQNTWITKDACQNERTHIQKINVSDKEKPSFVNFPADVVVECHNIPVAVTPTFTDNCSSVTISFTETKTPGSCTGKYTINRTWLLTDACNNTFTKTQTIQVVDIKAPVMTGVPSNVSVNCNAIPSIPVVTATDLCDPNPVITFQETKSTGCSGSYTITRTWKATDVCNNQQTLTQLITVIDNEKPVFNNLPNSISTACSNIPAAPVLTATDNCTINVQVQYAEQKINGSCPNNYILKRTWTATDSCGNTAIHIQEINVSDTEAPVIANSPADLTVSCENLPNLISLNVSDNCDLNPNVVIKEDTIPGICPNNFSLIRTWNVKDACQNETTITQKIVVKDELSPVFLNNPGDLSVSCSDSPPLPSMSIKDNCDLNPSLTLTIDTIKGFCLGSFQVKRSWLATDACGNDEEYIQRINFSDNTPPQFINLPSTLSLSCDNVPQNPTATATDNCDPNPKITYADVKNPGCAGFYTISRTWTAVDLCLNTTNFVQTITVTDPLAPQFVGVPANVTVNCNAIPTATNPTATDNCDPNPVITFSEEKGIACVGNYTITRKWKAKDVCGNEREAVQIITVVDNTPPQFINPPANLVIPCNSTPPTWTPTYSDNCDPSPTITFSTVTIPGSCPQNFTIERTWEIQDVCGNKNTHKQIIQVKDEIGPQLVGVPASVQVSCNAIPAVPVITATDNCDMSPTVTQKDSIVAGTCAGNYVIFRIWKATDQCGNSVSAVQQINVIDNVPPVFSNFPADLSSTCNLIPPVTNPAISDLCDPNPTLTFSEIQIPGSCPQSYLIQRTWIAKDQCGNTLIKTQNITIKDEVKPSFINLPVDISVNCNQIPVAPVLQGIDLCDAAPTIQFSEVIDALCVGNYKIQRTWTIKDACNNTDIGKQTITVIDNIPPVFSGIPNDAIINCGEIPALPTVTATDNCSTTLPPIQFLETKGAGTCPFTEIITRTWEVTDVCGNTTKNIQKISLKDDIAPSFSNIPTDIVVNCDQIPLKIDPLATDNCDLSPIVTFLEIKIAGSCPQNYQLERKWTATDKCGNASIVKQIIQVQDDTAPVFSGVPANVKVSCPIIPTVLTPIVLDNCDATPTLTFKEEKIAGSCPGNYNLVRTWTAEDACKNTQIASQTIEVTDTEAPTIKGVPGDVTASCNAIPTNPTVTVSDLCDLTPLLTFAEAISPGTCPNNGVITRTWKAIDACGNVNEKIQKITLQDTEAPTFINPPSSVTVNCDLVPPVTNPQISDNCDISPTLVFSETTDVGCLGNYKIIRKWVATDNCNNSKTYEQTITVNDLIAPVIIGVPNDVTVNCINIPPIVTLTATDNCDNNPSLTFLETKVLGSCVNNYVLLRKWTSLDKCGNKTEKTQTITVQDNEKPVFTNTPVDLNLSCTDPIVEFIPTATDNCSGLVIITKSENKTIGSCPQNYTLEKTWTATDVCGNTSNIIQKISVVDKVAPLWNFTPSDTVAACSELNIPNILTATDNCSLTVPVKYTEVKVPGTCTNNYNLIRTWEATDGCGNDITHKQMIKIEDNIPPTLTEPGADQTLNCKEAIPPMSTLTWTDNCNGTGSIPGIDFSDGKSEPEVITRTWEYKDPCGNGVIKTQKFTIFSIKGTLSANLPLCVGNELALNATGGDTYTWSGPNGFTGNGAAVKIPTTTEASAGNYTVQVKDLKGCSQTLSKAIDFLPKATSSQQINLCTGRSYTINGKTYSTAGQFTEIIKNGASNGCDSAVSLSIQILQSFVTNISANICPNTSYSFFGRTLTAAGNYTETLVGATVGGCDSTINLSLNINSQVVKNINETICAGQKYTLNGTDYTSSGLYEVNFPGAAAGGCDSLVKLNLTVKPNSTATISQNICTGESYIAGNQSFTSSGNYTIKLVGGAKNGCDSTINLTLIVNQPKSENKTETICEGQLFNFNGSNINKAGSYTRVLKGGAANGCDSTINLTLVVNELKKGSIVKEICTGSSLTENGQTYNLEGTYNQILSKKAENGCDSLLEINLKIIPNGILNSTLSVCEGGTYTWNGEVFIATGIYQRLIPKASGRGCDSILNLNFTVNKIKTAQISQTKCFGESYFFDGKNINQSGTYTQILKGGSAQGCDSVTTLILNILQKKSSAITATICEGESYIIGSTNYSASGNFTQILKTSQGCDSLVDLNLSVKPLARSNIDITICEGTFIVVGGRTFNAEGNYTQIVRNGAKNGCDSIINLSLKIAKISTTYLTEYICPGKSFSFFDRELNIPGKYKQVLSGQNMAGCDSIIELELLLAPPLTREIFVKICPNRTFTYRNLTYSVPSVYAITLPKAAEGGCDSLILIRLENYPDLTQRVNVSLCLGEKYQFKGKTYDKAGTYYERVNSASDVVCDSLYIIDIKYIPEAKSTLQNFICFGDSVKINNQFYLTAGSYFQKIPKASSLGCDSTIQINIAYYPSDTNRVTEYLCNGDILTVQNQAFTNIGTYLIKYPVKNRNGCDSILKLTILPALKDTLITKKAICNNDSTFFGALYYKNTGIYRFNSLNQAGCSRLNELQLTVNNISTSKVDALLCPGERYAQWGNVYTAPGVYNIKLKNEVGCDSTITFNLVWQKSDTAKVQQTICEGDFLLLNNQTFTSPGIYFQNLKGLKTNGCDSTIQIKLSVNPIASGRVTASFCQGKSYTLNAFNYTTPGTYVQKFAKASANQCDSLLTLNLISLNPSVIALKKEICWNDSVTFENKTYKTSGNFNITLLQKNAVGCDSTINLSLVVTSQPLKEEKITICQGDAIQRGGKSFTLAGDYTYLNTAVNNIGCDTLVQLKINVSQAKNSSIGLPLCPSDTIRKWGETFTATGIYQITLDNAATNGCDSIIEVKITAATINKSIKDTTICLGDTLIYNGLSYFKEGKYIQQLKKVSASGCDSIVELNIKVINDATLYLERFICPNDEFPFFETSIKTPGTYIKRFSGFSKNGCDSLIVLTLNNYFVPKDTLRRSICEGDTIQISNFKFFETGIYTKTERRANVNACDSIWTLILEVNKPDTGAIEKIFCLGDTVLVNGTKYAESGNYSQFFPLGSSKGCDSLLLLDIKTEPQKQIIEKAVLCYGEEIRWNDLSIKKAGIYEKVFPKVTLNGCDSLAIIEAFIYNEALFYFDTLLKPNEVFLFKNETYTDTGTYQLILKNAAFTGCDSIIRFKISRDPNFCLENSIKDLTICQNDPSEKLLHLLFENKKEENKIWTIKKVNTTLVDTIFNNVLLINLGVGKYEINQFPSLTSPCPRINYTINLDVLPVPDFQLPDESTLTCKDSIIEIKSQVDPSKFSFLWSTPLTFTGVKTNATISTRIAGKFALVVTNKTTGCFAADTTNIIDKIIYPKITAGQDFNFLCDNVNLKLMGEIFTLTYSPDILWKTNNGSIVNGNNTLTPEINKQGIYVLQVKDNSNDCISQDTVQIFPPSGEKINVIAQIQAPACNNPTTGIITIKEIRGGFPPYIVSFDGNISSNLIFQNLKGGQHFLSITDDIGCKTDTILLIKSPPEGLKISLGADQTIFLGDTIELPVTKNIPDEWIKNIQWEADRIPFVCKNCLAPEVFPFKTTTYKVTITDINGCQSSDFQVINVDERGRIYAPTAFSPNGDGVNDRFEIFADKSVERVEWMGIFDRWGTLVFEAKEFDPKIKGLGWDGTYLGKLLDPAVFVFAAKVKLIQGDTKIVKGEITLMR